MENQNVTSHQGREEGDPRQCHQMTHEEGRALPPTLNLLIKETHFTCILEI